MLSLLLLALPLIASAKAIFAFAAPAPSRDINIVANIDEAPALIPREWDAHPTEPYTLPMIPATTAISSGWTSPPNYTSISTSKPSPTSAYTYAETHNDDKNTHTHEIIAGVIGVIFIGIPVLATMIFCLCRRCRGSREIEEVEKVEEEPESEGRQSLMSSRYSVEVGDRERAGGRYPEIKYWV